MKKIIIWTTAILPLMLACCAVPRNAQIQSHLQKSNCNHQRTFTYSKTDLPTPIHLIELDTILTNRFSFQALNVANAIGLLDHLACLVRLKKAFNDNPTLEKQLEIVELLQKISQRINTSSLEISAVASEMDCEEERADQIATYLKSKEDDAETKLTVSAIVVGASGAIATGLLLKNETVKDYISIGTAITEALLGLFILVNKRKVFFYHPRNALRDIWMESETSEIFPVPVWYYLNYHNPNLPNEPSLCYQIKERWMNFGQIADVNTKNRQKLIQIYFGEGGKYSAEQLNNRANMHDQLEALISLMKQDLKGLAIELENLQW